MQTPKRATSQSKLRHASHIKRLPLRTPLTSSILLPTITVEKSENVNGVKKVACESILSTKPTTSETKTPRQPGHHPLVLSKKVKPVLQSRSAVANIAKLKDTRALVNSSEDENYTTPTVLQTGAVKILQTISSDKWSPVPRISTSTVGKLLNGEFQHKKIDEVIVFDCRFPYEFEGGHIRGAININLKEDLANSGIWTRKFDPQESIVIIFHCEYSITRGPTAAEYFVQNDRALFRGRFPNVYIMDGGYEKFWAAHAELCTPQHYVNMEHTTFEKFCDPLLAFWKKHWDSRKKLTRRSTPLVSPTFLGQETTLISKKPLRGSTVLGGSEQENRHPLGSLESSKPRENHVQILLESRDAAFIFMSEVFPKNKEFAAAAEKARSKIYLSEDPTTTSSGSESECKISRLRSQTTLNTHASFVVQSSQSFLFTTVPLPLPVLNDSPSQFMSPSPVMTTPKFSLSKKGASSKCLNLSRDETEPTTPVSKQKVILAVPSLSNDVPDQQPPPSSNLLNSKRFSYPSKRSEKGRVLTAGKSSLLKTSPPGPRVSATDATPILSGQKTPLMTHQWIDMNPQTPPPTQTKSSSGNVTKMNADGTPSHLATPVTKVRVGGKRSAGNPENHLDLPISPKPAKRPRELTMLGTESKTLPTSKQASVFAQLSERCTKEGNVLLRPQTDCGAELPIKSVRGGPRLSLSATARTRKAPSHKVALKTVSNTDAAIGGQPETVIKNVVTRSRSAKAKPAEKVTPTVTNPANTAKQLLMMKTTNFTLLSPPSSAPKSNVSVLGVDGRKLDLLSPSVDEAHGQQRLLKHVVREQPAHRTNKQKQSPHPQCLALENAAVQKSKRKMIVKQQ